MRLSKILIGLFFTLACSQVIGWGVGERGGKESAKSLKHCENSDEKHLSDKGVVDGDARKKSLNSRDDFMSGVASCGDANAMSISKNNRQRKKAASP